MITCRILLLSCAYTGYDQVRRLACYLAFTPRTVDGMEHVTDQRHYEPRSPEALEAEFPGWHVSRGVNMLWYTRPPSKRNMVILVIGIMLWLVVTVLFAMYGMGSGSSS